MNYPIRQPNRHVPPRLTNLTFQSQFHSAVAEQENLAVVRHQQFDPTQRQERHQEQSSDSALSDRVRHSKIDALQDALVDVDLRFL